MSDDDMSPALCGALVRAQREVKAALKSSENKFHGYRYASAEEVLLVGREALLDAGLAMVPMSEDFEPLPAIDDRCGGAVAVVRCKYRVIHESGAWTVFSTDVPVVPERGKSSGWSRPADKATFGARTEALGYALRDLLLIPRENAPDVSGRRDAPAHGRAPAPPLPASPAVGVKEHAELRETITSASTIEHAARALKRLRDAAMADSSVENAYTATLVRLLNAAQDGEAVRQIISVAPRAKGSGDLAVRNAIEEAHRRTAQEAP